MNNRIRNLLPLALEDYQKMIDEVKMQKFTEGSYLCKRRYMNTGLCRYFYYQYSISFNGLIPKKLLLDGIWYAVPVDNATSKEELIMLLEKRVELIKILMKL